MNLVHNLPLFALSLFSSHAMEPSPKNLFEGIIDGAQSFQQRLEEDEAGRWEAVAEFDFEPTPLYYAFKSMKETIDVNGSSADLVDQLTMIEAFIDDRVPSCLEAELVDYEPLDLDFALRARNTISRAVLSYAIFEDPSSFSIGMLKAILDLDIKLPGSLPKKEEKPTGDAKDAEEEPKRQVNPTDLFIGIRSSHQYLKRYTPGCYKRFITLIMNFRRYIRGDFEGLQAYTNETGGELVLLNTLGQFGELFKIEEVNFAIKHLNPFALMFGALGMVNNVGNKECIIQ